MIPLTVLILITALARVTLRSWLAPAAVFSAAWTIYLALSLLFSPWESYEPGLWWIVLTIFCMYLGNLLVSLEDGKVPLEPLRDKKLIVFPSLARVALVCILLAIFYVAAYPVFYDPNTGGSPWIFQLALAMYYVAPFFGGVLFATRKSKRDMLLAIACILPVMYLSAEASGRSTALVGMSWWLAGYLSSHVLRGHGRFQLVTKEHIVLGVITFAALVAIATVVTTIRYVSLYRPDIVDQDRVTAWTTRASVLTPENLSKSWEGLQSSTLGQVASFTWWFEKDWHDPSWDVSYAPAFFAGPLEFVGLMDRAALRFENTYFSDGSASNVYTIFRPFIQAFTLPGSLLIWFILGLLGGLAHSRVALGEPAPMVVLLMSYSNSMISGGLFFSYNSIVLALVVIAVYLLWAAPSIRLQAQDSPVAVSSKAPKMPEPVPLALA